MSGKKVAMGPRPTAKASVPAGIDEWVDNRDGQDSPAPAVLAEPMKRLTIDIPASLHRELKTDCAQQGTTIADVVRDLLIQKYRNP